MSGQVFIMNERVNESISWNGFNKIMRTGNGFNKVIMYILPSKLKREILFEATRTRVWLKLDVCSMCVRFATQPNMYVRFATQPNWFNRSSG